MVSFDVRKARYFRRHYHFKTDQDLKNLTLEEATRIADTDPDHATRDLYDAIGGEHLGCRQLSVHQRGRPAATAAVGASIREPCRFRGTT
ncbi:MAG: hypothetical protein AMJ46_00130 [Latescibacteria bacterium DG_63]|nr:MAG: hypothetical protein AMJ46_00130 [Latescibacteria bacterium DG_63]